jgi:outer membrane protein assembly factor BamB
VYIAPAVAEDLVYVGSCSGIFYALDKSSGAVKWQYDITNDGRQTSFHGEMLITEELVIVGTDGRSMDEGIGHVYAFERKTGNVRWKHFVDSGVPGDILRSGSNIFTVTLRDELICLDIETGNLKWKFKSAHSGVNQDLSHSPGLQRDRLFFGGLDQTVYTLQPQSGEVIWRRKLDSSIATSLLATEETLLVGAANGRVYQLNPQSGAVRAEQRLPMIPSGKLSLKNNLLFSFISRSGRLGMAEDIISVDLTSKKTLWHQPAQKEELTPLQPRLESPVTSTTQQCPTDETVFWSSTRPFFWNGLVLAGNNRGEVHAYRATDGKPVWSHTLKGTVRSFGDADNVLYVGTVEGTIFALSFEKL